MKRAEKRNLLAGNTDSAGRLSVPVLSMAAAGLSIRACGVKNIHESPPIGNRALGQSHL